MTARERYSEVLHKRHGWLAAPEGGYFELSANGKSVWLVLPEGERDGRGYVFPFGTRFNASSVLAFGDEA